MAIVDYLNELVQQKKNLVQNLVAKGVSASESETFNTLIPKVLTIVNGDGPTPTVYATNKAIRLDEWKFKLLRTVSDRNDTDTTMSGKTYDDATWDNVTVPHDWSIRLDFRNGSPSTHEGAYLDGGDAWYRIKLPITEEMSDQRIFVYFGGVYMESDVYVNGTKVGMNKHGYMPFYFDVTDHINRDGNDVVAVMVRNTQPSSRWYSGSGMYRYAHMITANEVAVGLYDTYVTTPTLEEDMKTNTAKTSIKYKLSNTSSETKTVKVKHSIYFNNSLVTFKEFSNVSVPVGNTERTDEVSIDNPTLWDIGKGNLYDLKTEVFIDGMPVHTNTVRYGYRWFKLDNNGFFVLNGKNHKIRGFCQHHDLGCIGGESNKSGYYRQLKMLQEMGTNALRSTHNPASDEWLDVADELGMIVIQEAFDCWEASKKTNDFGKWFNSDSGDGELWSDKAVRTMVNHGKNRACIVAWSLGNELTEGTAGMTNDRMVEIARRLKAIVKGIDNYRFLTSGDNTSYKPYMAELDWIGINYCSEGRNRYGTVRNNQPNIPVYGSETGSSTNSRGVYKHITENGNKQCSDDPDTMVMPGWGLPVNQEYNYHETKSFTTGYFNWTGWDYLGEPTPHTYSYPTKSAFFGQIDLAGFKKDSFYQFQSLWRNGTEFPMVHMLPTYIGVINDPFVLKIYSNCHSIKVYQNNELVATQTYDADYDTDKRRYTVNTTFKNGVVVVNGYNAEGTLVAQDIRWSYGDPDKLVLSADKSSIKKGGDDLLFISCQSVDNIDHNVDDDCTTFVTFTATGGTVIACDNGNSSSVENMRKNTRTMFNGKCLCVVKPDNTAGDIVITATAKGIKTGTITVPKSTTTVVKPEPEKSFQDATNITIPTVPVQSVDLPSVINVKMGTISTFNATIKPKNASNPNLVWSLENSEFATMTSQDTTIKITPIKVGSVTLTVRTQDSTFTKTCTVQVSPAAEKEVPLETSTLLALSGGTTWTIDAEKNLMQTAPAALGKYTSNIVLPESIEEISFVATKPVYCVYVTRHTGNRIWTQGITIGGEQSGQGFGIDITPNGPFNKRNKINPTGLTDYTLEVGDTVRVKSVDDTARFSIKKAGSPIFNQWFSFKYTELGGANTEMAQLGFAFGVTELGDTDTSLKLMTNLCKFVSAPEEEHVITPVFKANGPSYDPFSHYWQDTVSGKSTVIEGKATRSDDGMVVFGDADKFEFNLMDTIGEKLREYTIIARVKSKADDTNHMLFKVTDPVNNQNETDYAHSAYINNTALTLSNGTKVRPSTGGGTAWQTNSTISNTALVDIAISSKPGMNAHYVNGVYKEANGSSEAIRVHYALKLNNTDATVTPGSSIKEIVVFNRALNKAQIDAYLAGQDVVYGTTSKITAIELPSTLAIKTGSTGTVRATVTPEVSTESVVWTLDSTTHCTMTSEENVATINATSAGTATLTCKNPSGTITKTCTITITDPVSGTQTLKYSPTFYVDKDDLNGNVLTDRVGKLTSTFVTAPAVGTDGLVFTGVDGEKFTYTFPTEKKQYTLISSVKATTFNAGCICTIGENGTNWGSMSSYYATGTIEQKASGYAMQGFATVTVNPAPEGFVVQAAQNDYTNSAAQVSKLYFNGEYKHEGNGKRLGKAISNAQGDNRFIGEVKYIAVYDRILTKAELDDIYTNGIWEEATGTPITAISLPTELSVDKGADATLTATVTPESTTEAVVWTLETTTKCTMTSEGNVATITGVAAGTATVTCKNPSGSITKTCTVTITDPEGNGIKYSPVFYADKDDLVGSVWTDRIGSLSTTFTTAPTVSGDDLVFAGVDGEKFTFTFPEEMKQYTMVVQHEATTFNAGNICAIGENATTWGKLQTYYATGDVGSGTNGYLMQGFATVNIKPAPSGMITYAAQNDYSNDPTNVSKLYFNGQYKHEGTNKRLGKLISNAEGTARYIGKIRAIAVYNRMLTKEELDDIYTNGIK